MRTQENTTQPTPAQECERFIPFFIENLNARDCREALLYLLTGGNGADLTEEYRQSLFWTLRLMNSMADVQQTQTINSCTLKIA